DRRTVVQVRATGVHFDRGDAGPDHLPRRVGEFGHVATPDRTDAQATALEQSGQVRRAPCRDPWSGEADAVEHVFTRRHHSRWRVALPREGRERLHDDAAEPGQLTVATQLVAVARGARRRQDRSAQRQRSDVRGQVDATHPCSSCNERTRQPWARVSAIPFAAARPALRVVRHGTACTTQAARIRAPSARAPLPEGVLTTNWTSWSPIIDTAFAPMSARPTLPTSVATDTAFARRNPAVPTVAAMVKPSASS